MTISAKDKKGSRYRRVSAEMYSDAKFLALSEPKPNARYLWIYLFTGPFSMLVPGMVVGGEAGIAERLRWKVGAFRKCFTEIVAQGMARVDWTGPLIFLPNGLSHNLPHNPSIVRGWAQGWKEIPECGLKQEAAHAILRTLGDIGPAYADEFRAFALRGKSDHGSPDDETHQPPHEGTHDGGHEPPHEGTHTGSGSGSGVPPNPPVGGSARWVPRDRKGRPGRGHGLDERLALAPWSVQAFDEFLAVYPRKDGRHPALDAWIALNPDPPLVQTIKANLAKRVRLGWGAEPHFVMMPARYLNEHVWQEPYIPHASKVPPAEFPDGFVCVRTCGVCQSSQDGSYRNGQQTYPPCATCADAAVVQLSDNPDLKIAEDDLEHIASTAGRRR